VLIPSLYATSLRTRSLRPVRVSSDQNTRWRLPFHFSLIRDKNFLSPHIFQTHTHECREQSPRRRIRATIAMVMDQLKKQNPQAESTQRIIDPSRNNAHQDLLESQDSPKKQQKQEQHDRAIV